MSDRTILQVGPCLQVPLARKFRHRRGWWYVYLRSVDGTCSIHESDPWSTTAYPSRLEAHSRMVQLAHEHHLPWAVVRDTQGVVVTTSYHQTRNDAELRRAYPTDRVALSGWGKATEFETHKGAK